MVSKAASVCGRPDLRAIGRASVRRPRQEDILSPGHEPQASWVIKMFSVIFEVHPKKEQFDLYLALAKDLRPILEGIDGFVDNERFESARRSGWILSHSTWRDEKSGGAPSPSTTRLNSAAATTSFKIIICGLAKSCRIRRLPMACVWLNIVWTRRRSALGSLQRLPRFCRRWLEQDHWLRWSSLTACRSIEHNRP